MSKAKRSKAKAKKAKARSRTKPRPRRKRPSGLVFDLSVLANMPEEVPFRAKLLNEARDLTCGPRQDEYGTPSYNIGRIAGIRHAFWEGSDEGEITSPWGTAMDAVLTKIGRIASAPSEERKLHKDHYLDAINYLAIALEVASNSK